MTGDRAMVAIRWEDPDHLAQACVALEAMERQDAAPLVRLLSAWRFWQDPDLSTAAARALREHSAASPPDPQRQEIAFSAGPSPAWGLSVLSWAGQALRASEALWARPWPDQVELDRQAEATWAQWLSGDLFAARGYADRFLGPALRTTFAGVMEAWGLPRSRRRDILAELREGFFYVLLNEVDGGVPALYDLASRLLEMGEGGPVGRLAALLDPSEWAGAARCLARRRSWDQTLRQLWPGLALELRAPRLEAWLSSSPQVFPSLLDLHLALQLTDHLRADAQGGVDSQRVMGVLRHSLRRVRARLRAMVAANKGRLLGAVLALDGLHARTLDATRRFAWDWARRELSHGYTMGQLGRLTLLCSPPAALPLVSRETRAILRAWTLLVVIRGRLGHLGRWVMRGGTGDRDSTWGRLLTKGVAAICGPPKKTAQADRPHHRLRLALYQLCPELLEELRPTLRRLARLRVHAHMKNDVEKVLRPVWHAAVPFPGRGYNALVENAGAALKAGLAWERL